MDIQGFHIMNMPKNPRDATKYLLEILLKNVYPLLQRISNKLQMYYQEESFDETLLFKIRDVYTLCSSQIKKCILNLLDVFKVEYHQQLSLQESRQCVLERLSCCIEKLHSVDNNLESMTRNADTNGNLDNSQLVTTMYFVNWIDQTFEILNKLSTVIYRTEYKESEEMYEEWKNDVVECVSGLHMSIDELLMSAMTLCRYCLPSDQPIVKVRCQVVLRETKSLLNDLIVGDFDTVFEATTESLKLPIMPSNTNLLIDVLKDVLYVLETNTNTALLALLVHCFSGALSPVEVLIEHLKVKETEKEKEKLNNMCPCNIDDNGVDEGCLFVKDFDLYNERLMQIGSFAISCSSDQKRVLSLKSGLASLEALDPHLVPALMMSADNPHSDLLIDSWKQEVLQIKNNVFLIVDPMAFSDRIKQMMHHVLLEIAKENSYCNSKVCAVVNMGRTVHEFFNIYDKYEPEALEQHVELLPLLNDLNKVQLECEVVSNMLSSGDDFVYKTKKPKSMKEVSFGQLLKRLKLLYTLITRINALLNPKENDQHFYEDEPLIENRNVTHTVFGKNSNTYVYSPRRPMNTISRSAFTRTANIRSSTKFPLAILTRNLKAKNYKDLSFSVKLDEICDQSPDKSKCTSILYHSPMKSRLSLRKAILNRKCMANIDLDVTQMKLNDRKRSVISEKESLIDATTSLQITEVLNQISDLTNESTIPRHMNTTASVDQGTFCKKKDIRNNVLRLAINSENTAKFKHVWNISVNSSDSNGEDNSQASNVTQPSNVTTLERINDLDFVDNKLNELKTLQMETSL